MTEKIVIAIVFIVYMALMIGVGFYFFRKKKNDSDAYLLAGRQLNPWVASMSAQASDMSGWLLTALPGLAFGAFVAVTGSSKGGAQSAIWTAIGLLIGTMLNWILVARRLRVYTEVAGNSQTMPEYFQNRFDDKRGVLRTISAVIILIFFTVYTASMFSAGAKLFNSVFGLDYKLALVIGGVIIVSYVFLGGFMAVSYTDLIQGLLMFFTLMIVPAVMLGKMDSAQLAQVGDLFAQAGKLFPTGENNVGWMDIVSAIGWGLGYFGMPHILVRFMATKDKRTIKPATAIAGVWCTLTLTAAIVIGIVAAVFLPAGAIGDQEQVFIGVVQYAFPIGIAAVLLSAVLAAIMSTADSQLLVAASAFSNDVYKSVLRQKAGEKECVWVNRVTILVVSVIAVLIALDPESSIFELVSYAWAGFGASFGPLVLFSLYSKKLSLKGAAASMVTGAVTTVIFKYGLSRLGGFWSIYELVPGFVLASIVLWTVSALDRKKNPKLAEDFDRMLTELKRKGDDLSRNVEGIVFGADSQTTRGASDGDGERA